MLARLKEGREHGSDLFPLDTFDQRAQAGCDIGYIHWHDEVEILYGLDKLTTIGVADRPYYLNESDIIVIGAGENHCLFPSEIQSGS